MARRGHTSKAEATRSLLIDAALKVIGTKGYSAATVDEIVEEAGVSKGVAYYHFKNKADMATSVLERGLADLTDGFEAAVAEAPSGPAALAKFIDIFAARIFENGSFGRFFVAELWREGREWSDSMRDYEQRLMSVLRTQIERGQREGAFRDDLDPDFVAVSLVGMVLTASLYYTMDGNDARAFPLAVAADANVGKSQFVYYVTDFVRNACTS